MPVADTFLFSQTPGGGFDRNISYVLGALRVTALLIIMFMSKTTRMSKQCATACGLTTACRFDSTVD